MKVDIFYRVFLSVFLSVTLFSCAQKKCIPLKNEHISTEQKSTTHRDSVFVRDLVHVVHKNDTVYIDRWRTEYRDRTRNDTIQRTDTIFREVPVIVKEELTTFQKARQKAADIIIAFTAAFLIGWIYFKRK